MKNLLEAAGVENQLITIEGGGHGFDGGWWKPEVKAAQEQVMEFLDKHLK